MAKHARKVQQALQARRNSYDAIPSGPAKQGMNRPGSQNRRKTGFGKGRR